jgi:hypothetical protein
MTKNNNKYDFICKYSQEGFIIVRIQDKCGFIDENGNQICECKYDVCYYFHNGYARVSNNNLNGFINTNGIEVVECKYFYIDADDLLVKYILNQNRIKKLKIII